MPLPDEGLIHAWLDEQLPPDEAARVEQLVATDASWAAAAAEARGLIAATSRIVSALDHVPAGVMPKRKAAPAARRLPWWTKAAAAVVLVAGASTVVLRRSPELVVATVPEVERAPKVQAAQPGSTQAATVQVPSAQTPSRMRASVPRPTIDIPVRVATKDALPKPAMTDSSPSQRAFNSARLTMQEVVTTAADSGRQSALATGEARRASTRLTDLVVTGVAAQRTSAKPEAATSLVASAAAPVPAQKAVGGVAMGKSLDAVVRPGACYRLHDSRTSAEVGTVMRIGRMDGDTLRLESVQVASPLRAWVVLRDGTARGVLTTEAEGRGMIMVTALPASCPVP